MDDNKSFINQLLESLQIEEVRSVIQEIVEEAGVINRNKYQADEVRKEIDKYKIKLNEILEKNRNLQLKIKELEEDNIKVKVENTRLLNKLSQQQSIIEEKDIKIQELSEKFKEIKDIYKIYISLSENTISSLKGIFKGSTLEEFIFCGVQLDNIESFWEFCKREVLEGRISEVKELSIIFEYFLNAYNKTHETPIYAIQEIKIGEVFDEDKHTRALASKVIGNITEVVFYGYINLRNNKVIKKSVVKV